MKGIDIYNGDGRPDFTAVKQSGIDFIIHKATEGVNFTDASFVVNVEAARSAGLLIGAFHFLRATPIGQQAHDFLAAIKDHGPYALLAIDVENPVNREGKTIPEISNLGKAGITDRILTIYSAIRAAGYTCPVYVYASASWLRSLIDVAACRAAGLLIWGAAYSSDTPDNTDHSDEWDMWQYSDDGDVPGFSRTVDMDVCYRGIGAAPVAPPKPVQQTGNANIRAAQIWYNKSNFYNMNAHDIDEDGIWGPETRKAVIMMIQRSCNKAYYSGLTVDGIFGPRTEAAIRTLRNGNYGDPVSSLQAALMAHGYSVGDSGIDGKFGVGTEAAVKAYQRASGLTVDGLAGKNTFSALCK